MKSRPKRQGAQRHGSRYIPSGVKQVVAARDGERCSFVSDDGRRCDARGRLEYHHGPTTYARGGAASVENISLVCQAHNALFAERDYGRSFMAQQRERSFRNDRCGVDADVPAFAPNPQTVLPQVVPG